jgi:2-polyprenyl-6-methoxyphenol hydroxylase-like FAD-dependent oxidoreductase
MSLLLSRKPELKVFPPQDWEPRAKELGVMETELMIHRIDAHDVLRPHALSLPNVHLYLADGITAVETENATITLEDGFGSPRRFDCLCLPKRMMSVWIWFRGRSLGRSIAI